MCSLDVIAHMNNGVGENIQISFMNSTNNCIDSVFYVPDSLHQS